MNKILATAFLLAITTCYPVHAAKVNCDFDSGETYNQSTGAWEGIRDWESIFDMFSDGIELTLESSLITKLDSNEIFEAAIVDKGTIYLQGSESGITVRMTSLENNLLNIYDGYCSVGF